MIKLQIHQQVESLNDRLFSPVIINLLPAFIGLDKVLLRINTLIHKKTIKR